MKTEFEVLKVQGLIDKDVFQGEMIAIARHLVQLNSRNHGQMQRPTTAEDANAVSQGEIQRGRISMRTMASACDAHVVCLVLVDVQLPIHACIVTRIIVFNLIQVLVVVFF